MSELTIREFTKKKTTSFRTSCAVGVTFKIEHLGDEERDTLIHLAAGDAFERVETTLPCELISVASRC